MRRWRTGNHYSGVEPYKISPGLVRSTQTDALLPDGYFNTVTRNVWRECTENHVFSRKFTAIRDILNKFLGRKSRWMKFLSGVCTAVGSSLSSGNCLPIHTIILIARGKRNANYSALYSSRARPKINSSYITMHFVTILHFRNPMASEVSMTSRIGKK